MSYISRITSLKGFKNVVIGRDMGNVLKNGHVYGMISIDGYIIMKDLGEHADARMIQDGGTINHIITEGVYCLTKTEYLAQLENESKDFESNYHINMIKKLKRELNKT